VVSLLFAASFINYLDRATLSVALPEVSRELGLAAATKGVLLSAFFWSYALMQVPIGWLADRVDLRWLYAGTFALWSLACGLTGLAGSLAVLILFRIVMGIGESVYLPGGTKIVSLIFAPRERGLPSGLFDSGTRAGLALGAPLIAWLIVRYGWRNMFFLIGFAALLWLAPWLWTCPSRLRDQFAPGAVSSPPLRSERDSRDSWLAESSAPACLGTPRPASVSQRIAGARPLAVDQNLLGICLGFFCFDYYWYLLVTWLPDYLVTVRHLTLLRAGLYSSLPYFVFGISEPLGGWLADWLIRWGWDETRTRKGIVTIAFLMGLLLIPAARVETAQAALALIIGGSLVGLSTGNLLVILQSCAPPEKVGIWTGFQNFSGNLGGILAPLVTGFLIARTGSYFPGFALAALVLVTGLLAYWLIVGELKPIGERQSSTP
jgi:MFS family permease